MEIVYKAKDGTEFNNQLDCEKHERILDLEIERRNFETKAIKLPVTFLETFDNFECYLIEINMPEAYGFIKEYLYDENYMCNYLDETIVGKVVVTVADGWIENCSLETFKKNLKELYDAVLVD